MKSKDSLDHNEKLTFLMKIILIASLSYEIPYARQYNPLLIINRRF